LNEIQSAPDRFASVSSISKAGVCWPEYVSLWRSLFVTHSVFSAAAGTAAAMGRLLRVEDRESRNRITRGCIHQGMGDNGHRLTFLVIEAEPKDGLSTRKLLLESAKHNVITAYSGKEGMRMFERFPKVDVVCIDAELPDLKGTKVAQTIRDANPDIRVVALSPRVGAKCEWADRTVNSHDPSALLKLLEQMGGRTDI
jgi:CheY-like chemotaxis protein